MTPIEELEPVHRREDGELVGHLTTARREDGDACVAHSLFGAPLQEFADREQAAEFLRRRGLPLLAERWWYRPADGSPERPVTLVEARLGEVTVRFGYDRESVTLSGAELARLTVTRPG
ncbi:hypothetical protein ACI78Q_09515 [Geodermatophilus sp. SYSU D00705]